MYSEAIQQKPYNSFDIAKFICAISVILIHVPLFGKETVETPVSLINFLITNGISRIAVPLFFMFNGFFFAKKVYTPSSAKHYILRMLKLYALWSLIYFPISLIRIKGTSKGIVYGLIVYIKDFFLVGSYKHLWYLNALVISATLIYILIKKGLSPKKILAISAFFYFFGILGDGYYAVLTRFYSVPIIGNLINIYFKVFDTTRNALFFAFFFVSLGLVLSVEKPTFSLTKRKSLLLFVLSIFLLCAEALMLNHFSAAKDYNCLVCCAPAAFFCFSFLQAIDLKNRKIYGYLRSLSTLCFYLHLWIYHILSQCIPSFDNFSHTPIPFITTLICTLLLSSVIIRLSKIKCFGFLRSIC